jgi:hypothetical protein
MEKVKTFDQGIFVNLRHLVKAIDGADERHLDSHRLPNRIKHLKKWRKK